MNERNESTSLVTSFLTELLLLCILGFVVALFVGLIGRIDLVRGMDRSLADLLMRQFARGQLMQPDAGAPRIVFVNVSETACENWAGGNGTSCTLGMVTPRKKLKELMRSLTMPSGNAKNKPALVIIDIELAPLPTESGSNLVDEDLCVAVANLAQNVPVIALRPIIIEADSSGPFIKVFHSILFGASGSTSACDNRNRVRTTNGVWFASPLLQSDPDGKVRSVHAWDTFHDPKTDRRERVAGIGLLAAALLEPNDVSLLSCLFPGSTSEQPVPQPETCASRTIEIAKKPYPVPLEEQSHLDRLLFLLPYDEPGADSSFGYAPSVIDTVDAPDFIAGKDADLLSGAVVIIGGSYRTSGDLHVTPLGRGMPGAMVHANAVRAYATRRLVQEEGRPGLEALLVAIAALVGAAFYVLGLVVRRRFRSVGGDLIRILISAIGIIFSALVILWIGTTWALSELAATGAVLGVLTPALAVMLEGLCSILNELRRLTHLGISSIPLKKKELLGGNKG